MQIADYGLWYVLVGSKIVISDRYVTISRVLRHNITSGVLPAGLVLIEGPIAKLMQTSRAPVQASLRMLRAEGLIHRFRGRGYLVGAAGATSQPARKSPSARTPMTPTTLHPGHVSRVLR